MAESQGGARPLSPHLSIWRFTVTMAASITHRITGAGLYAGAILLTAWLLSLAAGPQAYGAVAAFTGSPFGLLILAGFAFSLFFHGLNGLRHLYWDAGRGLVYATAQKTAWAVWIGSFVLTAAVFWLALA